MFSSSPSIKLLCAFWYQTTPVRRKAAITIYNAGKNHFFLKIRVHLFLDSLLFSVMFITSSTIVNRIFKIYTLVDKVFLVLLSFSYVRIRLRELFILYVVDMIDEVESFVRRWCSSYFRTIIFNDLHYFIKR